MLSGGTATAVPFLYLILAEKVLLTGVFRTQKYTGKLSEAIFPNFKI